MIISKEEVVKIARMSRIAITEPEIDRLQKQLTAVLGYSQRVMQIAQSINESELVNQVNVVRPDSVVAFDAQAILAQAPEREENFFVVPAILEK